MTSSRAPVESTDQARARWPRPVRRGNQGSVVRSIGGLGRAQQLGHRGQAGAQDDQDVVGSTPVRRASSRAAMRACWNGSAPGRPGSSSASGHARCRALRPRWRCRPSGPGRWGPATAVVATGRITGVEDGIVGRGPPRSRSGDDPLLEGGGNAGHPGPDRRAARPVGAVGLGDARPPRRRRLRATRRPGGRADPDGLGPGREGCAQAPAGRAAAGRRDRPGMAQGPPGGRTLGARHLRRRRGPAGGALGQSRPPARTATRSPARRPPTGRP